MIITIVTAPVGGAVSTMGSDMADVLDDGDKLRAVPILGEAPYKISSIFCACEASTGDLPV